VSGQAGAEDRALGAGANDNGPAQALSAAAPIAAIATEQPKKVRRTRGWWLRQLHSWHWISAAVSLIGMLLFAITGVTLNHAASIGAEPIVAERSASLPAALLSSLEKPQSPTSPLPDPVAAYVASTIGLDPHGKAAEWSDAEVYVAMPRPGGDAWVSIQRADGAIAAETTDRGWISYLNDLHKGRNTGNVWFWFIDIFAVACIVFTISGLLLLNLHAKHRRLTWPIVGFGLALPVAIALFFIH
jgi:hypothetical protein